MGKVMGGILAVLLMVGTVQAWDVDVRATKVVNSEWDQKTDVGAEVRFGHDCLYLWGSVNPTGLYSEDFRIWGVGVGIQRDIVPGARFYAQAGRYFSDEQNGEWRDWEAMHARFKRAYGGIWDVNAQKHYAAKIDDGYGGEVGVILHREIVKSLTVEVQAGYRFLRLTETLKGYNELTGPTADNYLLLEDNRDFGGWVVGAGLRLEF